VTAPHDPTPDQMPAGEPVDVPVAAAAAASAAAAGTSGKRRRKDKEPKSATATFVEWALVIGGAVVLAIVVKAVLLQAFYIPSESMYPTLQRGDRVLVNKLSYRLHDVNRGDIVVFERPPSETATDIPDLIKRVVGLSGEQIVIEGGRVLVDGEPLEESYLPEGVTTTADNAPNQCPREDPCLVPEGEVWVMGDNRNDSKDSRYFGPIEEDTIVGRAFVVVWPLNRFGLL
jgi:signal peptidase I